MNFVANQLSKKVLSLTLFYLSFSLSSLQPREKTEAQPPTDNNHQQS